MFYFRWSDHQDIQFQVLTWFNPAAYDLQKNEISFKFCVWASDSIKQHVFSRQKLNTSIRKTLTQTFIK